MKKLIFAYILFAPCLLFAQSKESWKLKVAPKIFEQFEIEKQIDYFIVMEEQANVSFAKTLTTKEEKGAYVYNTLKEFNKKSQRDIINFLEDKSIDYKPYIIINAILAKSDYKTMAQIANMKRVKSIAANPRVKKERALIGEDVSFRTPDEVTWGVEKIGADKVWDLGYKGKGVVVGGQDTGYRWTHEAIKDAYRGWDGSNVDHNYNWYDAVHNIAPDNAGDNPCGLSITEPCDDNGHGTHTMGTMVGNNGIGVAPEAKWIACRNMERGAGTPSTYIECFEWFLAPKDINGNNPNTSMAPDVINNSWHCPTSEGCNSDNFQAMETAVNNLKDAGITVVVSAGNSGLQGCSSINSPPNFFERSFDVGATDINDTIAGFSSRGPTSGYGTSIIKPNISAPGVNVLSATNKSNSSYASFAGTSMAGPHVAGAVALLIDAIPSLRGKPEQIEDTLQRYAIYLETEQECGEVPGTQVPNNTYGYGRLDIYGAISNITAMPIKILYFTGDTNNQKQVELHYKLQFIDLEKTIVEHSKNGLFWEELATVANNDSIFIDKDPYPGLNYYRLKLINYDGLITYSDVISVQMKSEVSILNYPTIITSGGSLFVEIYYQKEKTVSIDIFNTIGEIVYSGNHKLKNYNNKLIIPVVSNYSGVHFMIVTDIKSGKKLAKRKIIVE